MIVHIKIIVLKRVSLLKEFELHFETRQEYIKAGNEKRMADEKRELELKEQNQSNSFISNNLNDPLQAFKETQKALLKSNSGTTEADVEMSRENAKFLKPEQTNQIYKHIKCVICIYKR